MTAVLVAYATGEGQTATVAERIGSVLDEHGLDPTTVRLSAGHRASTSPPGDPVGRPGRRGERPSRRRVTGSTRERPLGGVREPTTRTVR